MVQGNPNFEPASFLGGGRLDGVPVWRRQLPVTMGGVIGDLPAGEVVARFGRVVSLQAGTQDRLALGVGACPLGVLIASDEKMQNSMALADGYFAGQPATFICFGELQYKNSGVGAGLKSASIGGKVLADDVTGEIGFVDFDDTVPVGYTQLVATVERVNTNVVTVFFGLKTLLVEGTGVAVTEQVTTPVAVPGAGAVAAGTRVVLTTATPGARILYTLDGAEPDSGSAEYTAAITVDAAVTIKAVALKAGAEHSALLTAAYTIA